MKIADYKDILSSQTRLLAIVKDEALAVRAKFADERRTEIAAVSGEVDIEDLIPREECVLTLTNFGYAKRQKMDTYKTQRRGGRGISGMTRRDEDVAAEMFVINSHDYVMFFTNLGRVYRLKCYEIPEGSRTSKGMNIANLLPLGSEERVTSMIRVPEFDEDSYLVMVTRQGIIKRTSLSAYNTARKGGVIAIDLDEGDELAWVSVTDGNTDLLVATKEGHGDPLQGIRRPRDGPDSQRCESLDLEGRRPGSWHEPATRRRTGAYRFGNRLRPPVPHYRLSASVPGRKGLDQLPCGEIR